MYEDFLSGYAQDPKKIILTEFSGKSGLVIERSIPYSSMCEHHLLPFYGRAYVGYIPDGKVIGISKIPRLVEALARRLQIQERLTSEITKEIWEVVKPKGVIVMLTGFHTCVFSRGVQSTGDMVTFETYGAFKSEGNQKLFFEIIKERDKMQGAQATGCVFQEM